MDAVTMHEARDDRVAGPIQPEAQTGRPADDGREPLRRCIVTRESRPRRELLRLVIAPDGTVVPDIEGRLPGRGLWITPARPVIAEALRRGLIAKAAKRQVTAPADLADRIEAGLTRRCLDLLGLARRAGQATAGFEKVRSRLREGKVGLLIEAADGAADGRRKLVDLAAALAGDGARVPMMTVLSAAELAAALGRETAVHVAVAPGRLASLLRDEAARLAGLRAAPASGSAHGPASGEDVGGQEKSDRNEK
jgi:hypothetical protein